MGYIKEPDGVDFVINGKPLTDKQKLAVSKFIKVDKAKQALKEKRITQKRTAGKATRSA